MIWLGLVAFVVVIVMMIIDVKICYSEYAKDLLKVDTLGGITDGSITSIEVQNNTPKKLIITENKNFDLRSFFIITTYEYTFV